MTNAVNIAGLGAALTVSSNVVNFSSTPTVAGSPIGASAATPTALGTVYGKTDSTSQYNTYYGNQAGNGATLGTSVAIGYQAMYTGGNNDNVAIGYQALYTEGSTGNGQNVAIGSGASKITTSSAYNNVFVGYHAVGVDTMAS